MNDHEVSILKQSPGADPKTKRNSGLFSFLRWFKSTSRESVNSDIQNSISGTSGSSDSINSTGTAASFSFVPPTAYVKNKVIDKCIAPGPETDTYKARLKQRDKIREKDKNVTLRKKYNLFFHRDTINKRKLEEDDNSKSLPLMTKKMEDERGHRRTNSDSSKNKKAGAYLHVKGKRKAPQPPKHQESTLSLRRKKRLAPPPPLITTERIVTTLIHPEDVIEYADADVLFNDSLKLDHGFLKPVKENDKNASNQNQNNSPNTSARSSYIEAPVSPRPWYKRNSSRDVKKENKYEPVERNIEKRKEVKIDKKEEKRKSGMAFLTNISELDREASEIIKKEHQKNDALAEMPEFMKFKEEIPSDTLQTPKRKSARDLIAKFNAITNVTKVTVNSAFFGVRESSVTQKEKRDYFGRHISKSEDKNKENAIKINDSNRNYLPLMKCETSACIIKPPTPKTDRKTWFCPKCNLENDYWRIICHVCSAIKPYFDDLAVITPKNNFIEKNTTKNNEIKHASTSGSGDTSINTALIIGDTNNVFERHLERSKTQIGFSPLSNYNKENPNENKKEEREKLKKMLIEMKNSLPKRKSHILIQNRKSTIDENPEITEHRSSDPNLNKTDYKLEQIDKLLIKKDEEVKQIKPSTSTETNGASKKDDFQLMRPKDFEDIYSEKSGKPSATHLYANLAHSENLFFNVPKRFSDIKNDLVLNNNNADTLEINRLLRRLENAIAKGDLTDAAGFARELAQLKVNCSVIRQKSIEKNDYAAKIGFMVEMYVEDRLSHRGPFPIQVTENETVAELKKQVEKEFEIPVGVQRWILGKELATSDIATLKDLNVTTNGCPVFLYLVAPTNNAAILPNEVPIQDKSNKLEQKEINIIKKTTETKSTKEIKQSNIPSTPRIVEEKFKPIDKIGDTKLKEILKLTQEAPKIVGQQFKVQNRDVEKLKHVTQPTKPTTQTTLTNGVIVTKVNALQNNNSPITRVTTTPTPTNSGLLTKLTETTTPQIIKMPAVLAQTTNVNSGFISRVTTIQTANANQVITVQSMSSNSAYAAKENNVLQTKLTTATNFAQIGKTQDFKINITHTTGVAKTTAQNGQLLKTNPPHTSITAQGNGAKFLDVKNLEPPKAVEEDFTEYDKTLKPDHTTWECSICTLINPKTTNICNVCTNVRQNDATNTAKRLKKKAPRAPTTQNDHHYLELMNLDNADLVENVEAFDCLVCLSQIPPTEGITLRECLHQFCKVCLANTIEFNDEAEVKCPFRDDQYSCDIALQDREIKALVTPLVYDHFLAKSVTQAENKTDKSFHCKTPDCKGWCIFEDNVNEFRCPVCRKINCLTCQAIHFGLNCKQYQERMNDESETDDDAKRTREMLEEMVNKGEALTCPACQVILMKKWGCDWVRCSMCKTEICWVTKGLRWGPAGKGDTSGGCKCGLNGIKCHPKCNYCH